MPAVVRDVPWLCVCGSACIPCAWARAVSTSGESRVPAPTGGFVQELGSSHLPRFALAIPVISCISAKLGGLLGACHLSHCDVRGRKQGVFPLLLSLLHKCSSAAPPRTGRAAGAALTSLKESQGLLSDMKTNPSIRFLSPQWRFSLYSSSRSCLETSLVVAGVKEDVQLPFQLVDKSKLKPFPLVLWLPALLFLGGAQPPLPGSPGVSAQLCSPVLEQGTGTFPSTSTAKLQLTEPDVIPLIPRLTCKTSGKQSFNPFLCL